MRQGEIYFLGCAGFIKIGFTITMTQRLINIQTSNPNEVVLIHKMSGTLGREGEIHNAFGEFRARGEWFRDVPELRAYIDRLKARGDRVGEAIRRQGAWIDHGCPGP